MERTAWTDERLDDLSRHLDGRFDQIARRFDRMERRFDALQQLLVRIGGGVIVGLVGVIAAVLGTA